MLAVNNPDCLADIARTYAACEGDEPPDPGDGGPFVFKAGYPNPFNPDESGGITLEYDLPAPAPVTVEIYTLTGKYVCSLDAESDHAVWDGLDADGQPVASGVYVARMRAGDHGGERRVVLIR